ncbi:disulfide bond formation protein B [Nordella sp. HKS 07]|uniref:disulfide bond formation protein B n=1 Tax=Nordella sp. HKS 07 TaxID=2712222 RepID=UPI0013E129C0|nr:disulfide bond formation protein B [Nordella sp. HKS 07]QIG48272.1 disulfide bond formation protein B [Nordella sp. HKS 07]
MITQRNALMFIFIVSLLTIIGAFLFQWAGYEPCPLCYMQRWAYYAAIPLSLIVAGVARSNAGIARWGLLLLALIFIANSVFGIYHAGAEWKFWPGPTTCGGSVGEGLPSLTNEPVVSCEEAAIRIFGLSLAGWNAVICAVLAVVALKGASRKI